MKNLATKHYIIGAVLIVLAFAAQPFAVFYMQRYIAPRVIPQPGQQVVDVKGLEVPTSEIRHLRGNKDAKIYLVEFIDYECYFCNQFHNTITNVFNNSNGKVALVHKHFPLSSIHPHATNAAIASECVSKLSGNENFWKYADTLIINNKSFSDDYFKQEALKLGIKAPDFNACINDAAIKNLVDEDQSVGSSLGVQGTPFTLVVKNEGGKLEVLDSINGAQPESVVKALVDKYLVE